MAKTFKQHSTRESWLEAAVASMREWFAPIAPLPARVRVSTGFPSAWSRTNLQANKAIGQCWHGGVAADGVPQVFISPILDDAVRVGDVLVHELIHAALGAGCGHRRPFARAARALGLDGPMRATTAGPALRARLVALTAILGPYPHAALRPETAKRQTTRQLLIQCMPCDYKLRGAQSTLERGIPSCPMCGDAMTRAVPILTEVSGNRAA